MKCALITVYQPEKTVVGNIHSIAQQVDLVYICDNSDRTNWGMLSPVACAENVRYVWFGENLGLSRAFNRILKDENIPWQEDDYILFFDQDSHIEQSHVDTMIAQFEALRNMDLPIGCLGPVYFNTSSGNVEMPKKKRLLSRNTYAVSSVITSSMLSTYGDLRAVDFWNEEVFLDLADWDLCWRMIEAGKLCCLTDAVTLRRSVGSGEAKAGPLRLRIGAPFREYYQIRDCLYLLQKKYTPLKYRIRFCAMLLIRSPLHILFLENGKERMKFISMGIQDFRKKKKGPLVFSKDKEEVHS